MCKFCNNTPLRLLTKAMTPAEHVEARAALESLGKLLAEQEREDDDGGQYLTSEGLRLEQHIYHLTDVLHLRMGDYSAARDALQGEMR